MNFNFQNPQNLQNVYSVNPINESNIPLNPRTYNTIKKQISINSEFRKKELTSFHDKLIAQRNDCCDNIKKISQQSSSNFTIDLCEPIDKVISLELVNVTIPVVNKTISQKKNNNKFIIQIYSEGRYGADSNKQLRNYLIEIPDGIWVASEMSKYLKANYFSYKPESTTTSSDVSVNHLGYLQFEFEPYSGKSAIRFKDKKELNGFRTNDASGLLQYDSITDDLDFYFQILNYDNFNYENYIYPDSSLNFWNIEDDTNNKDCSNNFSKFVQGFTQRHINDYTDNFKFTTLGTFGFDFDDIYDINGTNITPKKFKFNDTKDFGLKKHRGYLSSKYIYGQFSTSSFYVRVNDFIGNRGEQIIVQNNNQSQICDNILAIIPVKSNAFSINVMNNLQDYSIKRNYFGGVKISKLQIQIFDKYGCIVDLDDFPTNFIFEFTQEYSSERLSNFRNRM